MHRPRFVPSSTYRLQVFGGFPLTAARAIVPYLKRLGIGAVYTSPYFAAEPGSTHGYDVTNHNELNPEVGGLAAHTAFTDTVMAEGLQHVVDFVPNHMGINTATNAWWRDVLENGPKSPAASFFDIDWRPVKEDLRQKLLLPILGDQYGVVLERGDLQLAFRDGHLLLTYFDTQLPINPRQVPRVYRTGLTALTNDLGPSHPDLIEFLTIVNALQSAPPSSPDSGQERARDAIRARLQQLTERSPRIRQHIDAAVREFNGAPGRPESFDALHEVLEQQAYRLAYWRTASHEINYRRFFDINALAGLRVESPMVFDSIHHLLERFIAEGRVTGVRIDHPDGLFDPTKYFDMLQDLAARAWGIPRQPGSKPIFVVAEKILSGRERLSASWCVHGTTGYNFLNQVNGLFVDSANARPMRRVYAKLTGRTESFDDLLYEAKRLIMDTSLASELNVLAHMLNRISESNRKSRDFTLNSLRDALVEVVACFPVYRTYVTNQGWTPEDRASLERAIVRARRRNPATDPTIFDFFREVVLPRDPEDTPAAGAPDRRGTGGYAPADTAEAAARLRFAMRFQQYTAPVQAKGLEDTAFYRYNLLLSLNDVGGDPSRFGASPAEFHELNGARLADWPYEMTATSTHDTKLGEDVRARIDVLSELPDEWGREVARWMRMNREARTIVEGEPAPERNDEYRFYQALAGIWPPGEAVTASREIVERLQGYMTKSVKEAKLFSSWINPNEVYETAVSRFVEQVLTGPGAPRFLSGFLAFHRRIARVGIVNSLAQTVLKIASPGVPDIYQGAELWDLTLVDPDNRRPIDFDSRARALDRIDAVLQQCPADRADAIRSLGEHPEDGTIKLFVTTVGLRVRAELPELFLDGDYLPLTVDLTVPAGAIAFARVLAPPKGSAGGRAAIVVAPHLVSRLVDPDRPLALGEAWKTSRVLLPPALASLHYRDAFTGAEITPTSTATEAWLFVGQVFQSLPVALLVGHSQ